MNSKLENKNEVTVDVAATVSTNTKKEDLASTSPSKSGDKNHNSKGDDVGIDALHRWVNRNMPKPESDLCQFCNERPLYDAANIEGIYNRDFVNWRYLCRSCHEKWDIEHGFRPTHHTTEARQKVSKNHADVSANRNPMYGAHRFGEDSPMFGKHLSADAKEKLQQANLGKHLSEQTKVKIGLAVTGEKNGFYGKHHSAESNLRIKLTNVSRRYAYSIGMSGRFQGRLLELK